jgi:ketosteroid isomerase-like protein
MEESWPEEASSMADTETKTRDEAEIRGLVKERIAALRNGDADRLTATYAAEVVKFDLAPPLQVTGPRVADPGYWRPWLGRWAGPITLDVTELGIFVGGDIAFGHSLDRMRGTKADGGLQDLWYRATLGLRKTGGTWKITHEHNSTPFYMDGSGRAANDLHPETSDA